jgi:PhnB protein
MWGKAKPVPEGFRTVTAHLVVGDAARAIDFYKQALGAQLKTVHRNEAGKVIHAALEVGDSMLTLSDELPGSPGKAPSAGERWSVMIHLYVENADETFNRALAAGATPVMPMMDAFWGDRYGQFSDPFGHRWSVATHKEDLSDKEIEKRGKEALARMAASPGA